MALVLSKLYPLFLLFSRFFLSYSISFPNSLNMVGFSSHEIMYEQLEEGQLKFVVPQIFFPPPQAYPFSSLCLLPPQLMLKPLLSPCLSPLLSILTPCPPDAHPLFFICSPSHPPLPPTLSDCPLFSSNLPHGPIFSVFLPPRLRKLASFPPYAYPLFPSPPLTVAK